MDNLNTISSPISDCSSEPNDHMPFTSEEDSSLDIFNSEECQTDKSKHCDNISTNNKFSIDNILGLNRDTSEDREDRCNNQSSRCDDSEDDRYNNKESKCDIEDDREREPARFIKPMPINAVNRSG